MNELRRECKKLMVDLGLDGMGYRPILAKAISVQKDDVNSNSLTMALTGYRNNERSREILDRLKKYLGEQIA